jgi:hypothetical protein
MLNRLRSWADVRLQAEISFLLSHDDVAQKYTK